MRAVARGHTGSILAAPDGFYSGLRASGADVAKKRKGPDLTARKLPSQERSRETFDAIVEACALVLAERGYAGTTTNHIADRAGVGISSLYEYFPGKDAVIAVVAERLVDRVLGRLDAAATALVGVPESEVTRRWIEVIFETVVREGKLVAVFLNQVPYTQRIEPLRDIRERLVVFSKEVRAGAEDLVRSDFSEADLHLVVNLVSSTIIQLVLDPPEDTTREALLDELARRVDEWIRIR
ncbi:MAG: TetR/AcrR family transcriptional regulator [Myxococcota bacterium]